MTPSFQVNGVDVLVEGEGRESIVMIHGWPDTYRVWDAQAAFFRHRYRCVEHRIERLRCRGARVVLRPPPVERDFGPIYCMAITPSAQMAAHGFTTTCTVSKRPMYAVIEVKTEKQGMPIDKLRPIAEKMSSRF